MLQRPSDLLQSGSVWRGGGRLLANDGLLLMRAQRGTLTLGSLSGGLLESDLSAHRRAPPFGFLGIGLLDSDRLLLAGAHLGALGLGSLSRGLLDKDRNLMAGDNIVGGASGFLLPSNNGGGEPTRRRRRRVTTRSPVPGCLRPSLAHTRTRRTLRRNPPTSGGSSARGRSAPGDNRCGPSMSGGNCGRGDLSTGLPLQGGLLECRAIGAPET